MVKIKNRRLFLAGTFALFANQGNSLAALVCENNVDQGVGLNVKKLGAIGDGITDDSDSIQKAIDLLSDCGGGMIFFPIGTYCLSRPLFIRKQGISLVGAGIGSILLRRERIANLPSLKIKAPGASSISDQYGLDAIIILQAPENGYLYNVTIKSISLNAVNCQPDFGIYAPRWSQGIISDVAIANCGIGYFTFNAWMCKFLRVTVTNVNRGFVIADDGSGKGAGTSQSFDVCWVNSANQIAWDIYGLKYSSFVACGTDHVGLGNKSGIAYKFKACEGVALTACGAEDIIGTVISASQCLMKISSFNASYAIQPNSTKTDLGLITLNDHSIVSIETSTLRSDIRNCEAVTVDSTSFAYLKGNSFKGMRVPEVNTRMKIDG